MKNSIAISALLTASKVQSHKHHSVRYSQSLLETGKPDSSTRNLEADFMELGLDALRVVEEEAYVDESAGLSFTPKGCRAGIERFEGKSNSEQTWTSASGKGKKWEDPEFGADDSSLSWGKFGFGKEYDAPPDGLQWKRPSEMGQGLPAKPSLFGKFGKPLPQGVAQGQLGDCWFLASASAVAEQPKRILKVIENQEYSPEGIFRFKFWVRNKWVGVNIDDRLPVRSWGSGFRPWATWPSKSGEAWWMPLLEKAFAKLNQNYDRIIGGNGAEGLRTLTGMPTSFVKHKDLTPTTGLAIHKYWAMKNFPATASCCNRVAGGIDGLITGHAYSFLDVAELKDASGKVVNTIAKVRNPWSKEAYKGPFRDDDPKWTEEWKKQVNLKVADDGIFWMPYKNYLKFFRKADVAFFDDYKSEIKEYTPGKRQTRLTLDNPVDQPLFITGEMYSDRHLPRASKCKQNNNVVMYFLEQSGKPVNPYAPYTFISWFGFGTIGKADGVLPKGKYTIWIVNQNDPKGPKDISFNIQAKTQLPTITGW